MTNDVAELHDYDALRRLTDATLFVVHPAQRVAVLGSSQSREVLNEERAASTPVRRRRGGGGLVLLDPDDVWIDWWIPATDDRWRSDVRASSIEVGDWWRQALSVRTNDTVTVHRGALEGDQVHRVTCFAGRGPGEVFVEDRKAVGLTQWRVREGIFVSTVLPAHASSDVVSLLAEVPLGLTEALHHHTLQSLALHDLEGLEADLSSRGGNWSVRHLLLNF